MDQNQRKLIHEFQNIVKKSWGQVILRTFPEENFSPPYQSDFGVFLDNGDRKIKKVTIKNLQPWLSMLELGLQWISSLYIMIEIGPSVASDSIIPQPHREGSTVFADRSDLA